MAFYNVVRPWHLIVFPGIFCYVNFHHDYALMYTPKLINFYYIMLITTLWFYVEGETPFNPVTAIFLFQNKFLEMQNNELL